MKTRFGIPVFFAQVCLAIVCLTLVLSSGAPAARKTNKTITKPGFDPNAEKIELFEGIETGMLNVKIIPKNSKQGNLLIENTTDQPLTVQMPTAFVGVHVLKQFGGGAGGAGLGGGGGGGGQGGQGGQSVGGGIGGQGGGGGGLGGQGGGGGGGFFSIPPEKTVRVAYHSVCLEHGRPEPKPKMNYRLVKVDEFTKDPALRELIKLIGGNRINTQVAQAAAWHLRDKMSWRQLAQKSIKHLGGRAPTPYFNLKQLHHAQNLVAVAVKQAKESKTNKDVKTDKQPAVPVRTRARTRTRRVR